MTTEDRRRELFAQPSAAKEVYRPDGHYLNGHIILRGPDGLWHLYYSPKFPGSFPNLEPPCDIGGLAHLDAPRLHARTWWSGRLRCL